MTAPSQSLLRRLPLLLIALAGIRSTHAATVSLQSDDGIGTSSFNTAGHWSNAAAPSSGNDYVTGNNLLRTPTTGGFTGTFAGDSLTINNTTGINDGLIFKSTGTSNTTVNNLIIDGGSVRDGVGTSDFVNLLGGIDVTSKGALITQQTGWNIKSAISGTGDITMNTAGHVMTFSGTNTWTGNLILSGTSGSAFTLANTGSLTFSIGASGVNNAITGTAVTTTFNGAFNFDLAGAGTTIGDSWTIVGSGLTKSFGGTFAVNGFTPSANLWTSANGAYQFNTSTGVLSVIAAIPEPSACTLGAGLAILGFASIRRRHRAMHA